VTYTRGRIYTIDSPDDGHLVARNMYRIGINIYKKKNCASSWLVTKKYKNTFKIMAVHYYVFQYVFSYRRAETCRSGERP